MFDAACPGCRRRFGWSGDITDRPPCPKCGHTLSPAELDAAGAAMDAMRAAMLGDDPPPARVDVSRRVMTRCQGDDDGDCTWDRCPQLRDGEPARSGRHCPLDLTPGDDD